MNVRKEYDFVDLIPIPQEALEYVKAAFLFREYASFKTLFGEWIQVGNN